MTTQTKRGIFLGLLGFGAAWLPQPIHAQNNTQKRMRPEVRLSAADKRFLMEAGRGGLAEVHLGQLAGQRGASRSVKQFGKQMVQDHSAANEELKLLAMTKGITLSDDAGVMHKAEIARLSKLSGAAFDNAYLQHIVRDHGRDMTFFTRASIAARDSDIRSFAEKMLPKLKQHSQMVTVLKSRDNQIARISQR